MRKRFRIFFDAEMILARAKIILAPLGGWCS
jgi:hypothetical protein